MLYVALRCVDSLKMLFTPFLPFSSQQLHELLGYEGWLAGPLEFREVAEADGGTHDVLTGRLRGVGRAAGSRARCRPGQQLREPRAALPQARPRDASCREELGAWSASRRA